MHKITLETLFGIVEAAESLEQFEESIARLIDREAPGSSLEAVLDFLDVPSGDAFDVPPEQALAFFRQKGLKRTFSWADMTAEAHDHAFTVAKMMDVDLLGQVRASLDDALALGIPFEQWSKDLIPTLQRAGWWGEGLVVDPLTGMPTPAQLGSPWRLETIFRTNMQSAYAVGQWREIEANKSLAPYLLYDAVDDFRTRPAHRSWDGTLLSVDHPFWNTHYPPNGFNCRCGVIQLSADEAKALGMRPGLMPNGETGSYLWTNPRTGKDEIVPDGIDPTFNHNAGKSHMQDLKQLLGEKIAVLPPSLRKAAIEAIDKGEDVIEAQKRAAALAEAKAAQEAKEALERARKQAIEDATQAAAKREVDRIRRGRRDGEDPTLREALLELEKVPAFGMLRPTEQIEAIEELAKKLRKRGNFDPDTPEGAYHVPAWKDSPEWLRRVVVKEQNVELTRTKGEGCYAVAGRRINMSVSYDDNPGTIGGSATWRHEFGHILDVRIASDTQRLAGVIEDARAVNGGAPGYISSTRSFTIALENDGAALYKAGKHRIHSQRTEKLKSYDETRDLLVDMGSKAEREAYLSERANAIGFEVDELRNAVSAQGGALVDESLAGQMRMAKLIKALEEKDAETFVMQLLGKLTDDELRIMPASDFSQYVKDVRRAGDSLIGNFSDLVGASSKNKVCSFKAGFFGHSPSYYRDRPGYGYQTEAFANLTALAGDANPAWWKITERLFPEVSGLFKRIIENA